MLKNIQKNIYLFLARNRIFYPLLFKILENKKYLEKEFDKLIRDYQKLHKNVFFIQIGANDGARFDPTYLYVKQYGWKGILIEPVNLIFKKLEKNYKGIKNLAFENVAIGDKNGFKKFYMLKKKENENLPLWYDEIGSFDKNHLLKHKDRIDNIEEKIIEEEVKVLTFKSLLKKHKVKKIDFLQIDTEGYDYHILKQIPFNKVKPSMILFEDRHLPESEKEMCKKLLVKNGYNLIKGVDCFAYIQANFKS